MSRHSHSETPKTTQPDARRATASRHSPVSFLDRTFGLHDHVVALAGGGGTIALALAGAFLDAGARVAIWSRRRATVDAAIEQLGGDAGRRERLCGVQADAGDEAAVDAALESTVAALGAPTVLLNGVGGNRGKGSFNDIDVALFEEVLRLNLVAGLVVPTKRVTAFWIDRATGGCIINVASMASYVPLSGVWAYDAAKAGVVNLTMACAKEYAPHGIRVNAIAPGFIVANQNRRLLIKDDATGELTERGQQIIDHTPYGRFADASEMTGAALFLASDQAAGFITGVTIPIDGGYLIHNV